MINIRHIKTTTYSGIQDFLENEDFILRIGILAGIGFELLICHQDPVSKEVCTLGSVKMEKDKFQALFVPETKPVDSFDFDENKIKQYLVGNYHLVVPYKD